MLNNIAVFVSGGGSNLGALIDAISSGIIKNAHIKLVVASKQGIFALKRAENAAIESAVYEKSKYESNSQMFEEIIKVLKEKEIDLIVLAGYLNILTPNIVQAFSGRIINIHPSLIPSYCGDGFYGMRVHEAAIADGAKISGATVHFVDEGTDTGEIIMQKEVAIQEGDTAETLQKRVLEVEHKLLPLAVDYILNRRDK